MKYWWLKLARYALPQWRGLLLIGALMLAGIAAGLLTPWPLKLIVDYVLQKKPLPEGLVWRERFPGAGAPAGLLAWLASATVALFLTKHSLKILQSYFEAGASSRMVYGLAADLFDGLQRRSISYHQQRRCGDLVKRITSDCGCVRDLVTGVYLPVITSLATLVAMFFIMWRLSPALAALAMLIAMPLGVVTRLFLRPMAERRYREKELQGEMVSLAEQTLSSAPVVQAFGREDHHDERFRAIAHRTVQANLHAALSKHQFKVATGAVTAAATTLVMCVGGIYVLQGSLTVGGLLVLLTYFAALYSPLETLAYLSDGFASASAGAKRVLEVLDDDTPRIEDRPGARPLPASPPGKRGHICFEKVTFGYDDGRPVLSNVSLEARPGEVVALVGRTGAGKSTLASLTARFHDPWEGRILYDGVDLRDLQLKSLRSGISLVLQEPFLLPLTVAENIAYGRPDASHDEIMNAARTARADEFIRKLPNGYDTVIGEKGATLSGGERQRLAIARALLKNAPVLIFDEPTSALDAQTEALLIDALEPLLRDRTTFLIAHRLSTIRKADRIVVLEHGRVVESGAHDELLAGPGAFASLHRLQFGAQPTA